MHNIKTILIFIALVVVLGFLVQNRHADNGDFNWRGELWADQAGYYIYLPSFFIYRFKSERMDPQIADKTGNGFYIDKEKNKIITKYTCGVAILQAPIFGAVHLYQKIFKNHSNGFDGMYHNVPNLAAIFYGALGLLLLFSFLKNYFSRAVSIATIVVLFFGTNLYYYTIDHTGMSHVYSFFLFAAALNLMWHLLYGNQAYRTRNFVLWSLVMALILLIRPTNALFAIVVFLLDCNTIQAIKERFQLFLTPKFVAIGFGSLFLVFLPQLLYWRYVSGNFVHYSYQDEGFSFLTSPKFTELWFAPHNGLFTYSPILLLLPLIALGMGIKKIANGWSIFIAFFLLSYTCASWHIYSFGCGFGSRNFVEYTVLFAIPFAYLIDWASKKTLSKWLLGIVFFVGILFTQKLIFTYDKCFFGQGDWDWSEYSRLIKRGYHHQVAEEIGTEPTDSEYIGEMVIHPAQTTTWANYERAWLQTVISTDDIKKKTSLVIETIHQDQTVQWQEFEIKHKLFENNKPGRVIMDFAVKKDVPNKELRFKIYIWNPEKAKLSVQKFEAFMK